MTRPLFQDGGGFDACLEPQGTGLGNTGLKYEKNVSWFVLWGSFSLLKVCWQREFPNSGSCFPFFISHHCLLKQPVMLDGQEISPRPGLLFPAHSEHCLEG
ncbi:hypothetical protein F2P79_000859 [Pimephales promelas]|nr:hypothetical protein F2P79_000859 [Pimephales promelas]